MVIISLWISHFVHELDFLFLFNCLSVFSCSPLKFLKWLFWIPYHSSPLLRMKCWSFISFLGGIISLWYFVILDSLNWFLCIWVITPLCQTVYLLWQRQTFTPLVSLWFLGMSAGNVLRQGPAILVYFGVKQLFELRGWRWGACYTKKLDRLLAGLPSQVRL